MNLYSTHTILSIHIVHMRYGVHYQSRQISVRPSPLISSLHRYIVEDKTTAQLQLQRCLDKESLQPLEPLPHLMRCALRCVHAHSEALAAGAHAAGDESLLRLRKLLERVSDWLATMDLQDYELEKCCSGEKCSPCLPGKILLLICLAIVTILAV